MGVIISLGYGKISVACCIISCNVCFRREFWGQREKELWVNTGSPALPFDRRLGVTHSVGPTLHNVGTQPSAFHAEHYPGKGIALKCSTAALIYIFRGKNWWSQLRTRSNL